jgi:hypothetical protein
MGDDFAAVYEATAHRITGPVSNTALDIVGVGPGTRIVDIAAGAGAGSGPAAERGAAVLATDIAPGMVRRLAERLRPFHRCEARERSRRPGRPATPRTNTRSAACVRVFGQSQQFWLKAIGRLTLADAWHAHVIDDQFQTGVALGDLADRRQEHRRAE